MSSSNCIDGLILAKVLTMVILGLGSFLLGVLPIELTKKLRIKSFSPPSPPPPADHQRQQHDHGHDRHSHSHPGDAATGSRLVSLLLCFGAGVLLYTTLVHLMLEVREGVTELQQKGLMYQNKHLADLLLCAGFFMVFFVDELAHAVLHYINSSSKRRLDGAGENVLHRSVSLRRSLNMLKSNPKKTEDGDRENQDEVDASDEQQQTSASCELPERYRQPEDTGDVEEQRCTMEESSGGEDQMLRGFFTVLALSIHEIFEGMAIGLNNNVDDVWLLFLAVATHKLVIAFCIGLELAWSGARNSVIIVYVATFSVVTPIGIAIGMIISKYDSSEDGHLNPTAIVLQGLAAGTLLYVVFFEVLARHKKSGWSHLFAVALGFGLLLLLQIISECHRTRPDNYTNGYLVDE